MDAFSSTSTSPSVNNQGIGRISDKRKISDSWKKNGLLLQVLLHLCRRCHEVWSLLCFLHGIVFRTQTLGIHVFAPYVMSGSDWGRHSKSCCKTPLGNLDVSTASPVSRGPATSSTTDVWNVFCQISRAEKVMRECDIHHTRSVRTLTWVASLDSTSAVTWCNIYRDYHVPTSIFYVILSYGNRVCSYVPSLKLSFI